MAKASLIHETGKIKVRNLSKIVLRFYETPVPLSAGRDLMCERQQFLSPLGGIPTSFRQAAGYFGILPAIGGQTTVLRAAAPHFHPNPLNERKQNICFQRLICQNKRQPSPWCTHHWSWTFIPFLAWHIYRVSLYFLVIKITVYIGTKFVLCASYFTICSP